MTEAFRRRGHEALLLTGEVPPNEESMESLAEARGIRPTKISTMSRRISVLRDLIALVRMFTLFVRERPHIVHTHTAKAGALGRIAAVLARVPIRVHTFHGHVFDGYFSPVTTRIFVIVERWLARHTTKVIAVSDSQRRELVQRYKIAPAEKVITVPLGFELENFLAVNGRRGNLRASLGCGSSAPLIGWIGRLTEVKDPGLFIDAIRAVSPRFPEARAVIIGDGELRAHVEDAIARNGLGDVAFLVGWTRKVWDVFSDLDFVVVSSRNEGTPLTLLEAMAAGKPFIAADVGGIRDLMVGTETVVDGCRIHHNGILTSRNPHAIARAAAILLQDPIAARRMGECGRKWVSHTFSHDALADRLEHLYHDLLKQAPSRKPTVSSAT